MNQVLIEVCCGSAEDVHIAAQAGAHRVELNSALFLGGLTPSLGTLEVARQVNIPIMAMVRPREGGFCYSNLEFAAMLADAKALLAAGADGIVFGCLHPDGRVDAERCKAMLEVIGEKESVFSRAIDVVPDWREGLDVLMELGVTRVLTSGQAPSAPAGSDIIRAMAAHTAGRMEILPGCGVKPDNVAELIQATGCRQLHGSFKTFRLDRSATHNPVVSFSGGVCPPDEQVPVTDGAAVRAAVERLQG